MGREVIFEKEVRDFLKDLVEILFEEEYFGFKKDAKIYVRAIVYAIKNYDFELGVRKSPFEFRKFGHFYIKHKSNNNTTWYVFFEQKDNRILVGRILNNHSHDYPELM